MSTNSSRGVNAAVIGGAALLLHAAFLSGIAGWLLSREHYQFFPVVLCASGILAWYRLADFRPDYRACITVRVAVLGAVSLLLFSAAVLLDSNWIGTLASLMSLWTLIWFFGGSALADKLRGPVLLLLLIVPLPLNLDQTLVVSLQKVASSAAGGLLDMFHIRHTISGVAIATLERSFMVEEACSGVHSLFSCLCVIAFICAAQHYSLFRTIINLVQTVGWVVVANTLRVFIVVYFFSRWDMQLDTGYRHELLGVLTYVIALSMSLSVDRLILFIVPLAVSKTPEKSTALAATLQKVNSFLNKPRAAEKTSRLAVLGILLILFAPLSVVGYAGIMTSTGDPEGFALAQSELKSRIDRVLDDSDAVPEVAGYWKQQERQAEPADSSALAVFTYSGNGLTADFSVNGFFGSWSDPGFISADADWKLQGRKNYRDAALNHATAVSYYSKEGEHAICLFSYFDTRIRSQKPENAAGEVDSLVGNLRKRLGWQADDNPTVPPVFRLQLVCRSTQELLEEEKTQLESVFRRLSSSFLKALEEAE